MKRRIDALRKTLRDYGVDGILITKPENWQYLSGFTGSNAAIIVTLKDCLFMTDFRYTEQAQNQTTGFNIVKISGSTADTVAEQVSGIGIKRLGFEDENITFHEYVTYKDKLTDVEFVPLHQVVEKLRWIKDDAEILALKSAAEITDKAFSHILTKIRPGVTELEIALEMEYFMRQHGAQKLAFDIIAASGPRAALPHGVASERKIATGDFVVLDFGAVYAGYHADMTRTVVIGKPDRQQEKIYDIVLRAQLEALKAVKPGAKCSAVDSVARTMIDQAGYGPNFGHGLGHSVGLEIHERPSLSPKEDVVLEPGMVVTVEPGIYINGWGGVRIEDLVCVTATGCEILSSSTKELIIL